MLREQCWLGESIRCRRRYLMLFFFIYNCINFQSGYSYPHFLNSRILKLYHVSQIFVERGRIVSDGVSSPLFQIQVVKHPPKLKTTRKNLQSANIKDQKIRSSGQNESGYDYFCDLFHCLTPVFGPAGYTFAVQFDQSDQSMSFALTTTEPNSRRTTPSARRISREAPFSITVSV